MSFATNRRFPTPDGFVNRRNPSGPIDHTLPVLRVSREGKPIAILASYACHCTTTGFNRIHGDWAGCAQQDLEKAFPGTIALTAIGCGGDQNPDPRGTYELAEQHGGALAREAARICGSEMHPLRPSLECRIQRINLPLDTLPTRDAFERRAADANRSIAYHAKRQIERLDRGEKLVTEIPYTVQTWSFGEDLGMVFLAGEVVVDYSLRLKREFVGDRLWINAYSNDMPCYIPSRRVLEEGGYEGEGAMVYYDRSTRLATDVEERIIAAVHTILPRTFLRAER